jgi:dTDP-4-amino-4,6-dideoxygalactose transaminase
MWARVKLDIGWADLAFGLTRSVLRADRAGAEARVAARFGGNDAFVCFSVRSGFDLLLQALALPPDTEVLFSALNVKGMVKVARRQGVVPVPVDLDLDRMVPDVAAFERAWSPRARVLVVAPLFGTRPDLSELFAAAKARGLLVVEDAAQAFAGSAYRGQTGADVSMFSFGPLKFATALGGAVLQVRDPALRRKLAEIQAGHPVQSHGAFRKRLLKFAGIKAATRPRPLGLLTAGFRVVGRDYENALSDSVRGVAALGSAAKLRKRPPAGMLALLERRIARFDPAALASRMRAGRLLEEALGDAVVCPGAANDPHFFWVFPILAREPQQLIHRLRRAGFDAATLGRSATVPAPPDRPELDPKVAREALQRLVVLPCHGGMPDRELRRLAEAVREACTEAAGSS